METTRPLSALPAAALAEIHALGDRSAPRAMRETTLLVRVTRLVASNLTLDEILTHVFGLLSEAMPIDRMGVVELNPFERDTVVVYPDKQAAESQTFEFFVGVARSVVRSQAPTVLAPKPSQAEVAPPLAVEGSPKEVQSVVAAPLLRQGNAGGALVVESHRADRVLTEDDAYLLSLVAMQVGMLLERERAVEEARRRMDQMAAFSAITSTVNEWVDVEQLARRFLSVFLNSTNTNYGLFYLVESEENMRMLAQFGIPPELEESYRLGHLSQNPDIQRIMSEGRMSVFDDVETADISADLRDLARLTPVQSIAIIPLRVKGRAIGAVALGRTEGRVEIADREVVQGLADQAAQAIENARLFSESQRRFEEQSALRELAQRFLSAVSPDEVIERTLDTLTSLLPGEYYEILLPESEGTFVMANGRGWRRGVIGRTHLLSDPHLHAGYVLRAQSPVIVENFATETRFQPSDYLMRHQIVAGVCAPMLAETRVIGLLGVYSHAPRQFTEEQSHFLYLVATQTAMALEKARHSQAAQRRLDELILLNDVIVAANSEVSLDRVLESVTAEIGALLQSDDVQLYLSPVNGGSAELRAARGRGQHGADAAWARTAANWVTRNRLPLLIPDLTRDLRFVGMTQHERACLGVPMTIGDRVIGVIAVAHPDANAFDANDLRLLTTLAGQIAAAIERARLLDETATRLAEISAMFDFSNALRTATTETDLVELVVRDAVKMLNGAAGSLQLLSPEGDRFDVVAVHNMRHLGHTVPRNQGGLSWDVYALGESLALEDVITDPRVRTPEVFEHVHGGILAPLRTPMGVLGTLFVGFTERGKPGQDKLRLATTIANLAAQALQRLRLHEQTLEQTASLGAALSELETSYRATLRALSAALDARDRETEGHSQRVTKLALALGRALNLSTAELTGLERGALLHDVGKIGISDNILRKPGPLTTDERVLMNRHPQLGFDLLNGIPFLSDALPIVLYHQEMYDGSGYPAGLRGEEIPLGARIFAVADAYDAMTSNRPYRKALSHEAARAEIVRCRGTQFDPRIVDVFLSLIDQLVSAEDLTDTME